MPISATLIHHVAAKTVNLSTCETNSNWFVSHRKINGASSKVTETILSTCEGPSRLKIRRQLVLSHCRPKQQKHISFKTNNNRVCGVAGRAPVQQAERCERILTECPPPIHAILLLCGSAFSTLGPHRCTGFEGGATSQDASSNPLSVATPHSADAQGSACFVHSRNECE